MSLQSQGFLQKFIQRPIAGFADILTQNRYGL